MSYLPHRDTLSRGHHRATTSPRNLKRATPETADSLPPEYRAAIQAMIEAEVAAVAKRRWIDPHAEADSVEQFGLLNGNLGRQLIYDQIDAGRLVAKKVGGRTIILRSSAKLWRESLPDVKPKNADNVAEPQATPPPDLP